MKCIYMIFKVKGNSLIKMHFNHHISKILVIQHCFCNEQPQSQHWGQYVRITFQVKCQVHRVIELKPFYYKLLFILTFTPT